MSNSSDATHADRTPELHDFESFLPVFQQETDRGAALLASAALEERLREGLTQYFVSSAKADELFEGKSAPIGDFSSRIAVAHAVGLINADERRQLELIRRIRNDFAHNWRTASFVDDAIANRARELPWGGPPEHEQGASARQRFNMAVVMLLVRFLFRHRHAALHRLKVVPWDRPKSLENRLLKQPPEGGIEKP